MSDDATNIEYRPILADGNHPLFDKSELHHKQFPGDYRQVRYFALLVTQIAPSTIQDVNILQQQVCELLRNAIKHGNKLDPKKHVDVWYGFSPSSAHVIVQDQGQGFAELDAWNEFNRKRLEHLNQRDFAALADYVSFRSIQSDTDDGGNALFAAVEYWNGGVVFNDTRNAVAVWRTFASKRYSRPLLSLAQPDDSLEERAIEVHDL